MKRHASLIPLSHEHHEALILARLLQKGTPPYKGLPTEPAGKAQYALKFYRDQLSTHFIREEAILPIVEGVSRELDALMESMVKEHAVLHELFGRLSDQTNLSSPLDHLGKTLENHIRKEERQIFPLIQERCSGEILDKIQILLSRD